MPGSQDSKLRLRKIAQQLTESLFNNVTVRKKQGNSGSGWGFWKEGEKKVNRGVPSCR